MQKVITFFMKTVEQLRLAFALLKARYRRVFLFKEYWNGFFEGHFIVEGYIRKK
jgi:hypothetical protein